MQAVTAKPNELLTGAEAAEYLTVQKQTLDNWRSTGRYPLPFIRIGARAIRYRRSDLDRFLSDRTVNPISEVTA
ncbi:MAG: helix-turn-helix domain-containing protein [Phycisphaerales bacterium]|nr:helix-turn-helix domain-containing protein [Phycisphaerales bacterium]